MKTLVLSSLFVLGIVVGAIAQSPDTLWTRTYGGAGEDVAFAVQQTSDGGYILAGNTSSFGAGGDDFYLVKTDSQGEMVWTQTYGGSSQEYAKDMQLTLDGGYIIVGSTDSFGAGSHDFYLVKTDDQGDTLWTRTYGGSSDEQAFAVRQTLDGGYIIAGYTTSFGAGGYDFYLVKTDSQGNTEWTQTYGSLLDDQPRCMQQTADGGYIIAGFSNSIYLWSVYLVKTDSQGDTLWTQIYEPPMPLADALGAYCIQQTSDMGYIIAGYALGACMTGEVMVFKTDSEGDTLWMRIYQDEGSEAANDIFETGEGNYIIAGSNAAQYQDDDVYLMEIDGQGEVLWSRTYGGDSDDLGYALCLTGDSCYVIAGCTSSFGAGESDFYLVKTGYSGPPSVPPTPDGSIPDGYVLHSIFPNPFNSATTISFEMSSVEQARISIYNLQGQNVATLVDGMAPVGRHSVVWDAGENPSGIYFCRMDGKGFTQTRKLLLLK